MRPSALLLFANFNSKFNVISTLRLHLIYLCIKIFNNFNYNFKVEQIFAFFIQNQCIAKSIFFTVNAAHRSIQIPKTVHISIEIYLSIPVTPT